MEADGQVRLNAGGRKALDAACEQFLRQVEALAVLREMRAEGMTVPRARLDPEELRSLQEAVRAHHSPRQDQSPLPD
ncbi:hypothetical protein OG897_32530 [Streptomyces sp. NBC_00237]|uniref:hypothetical protein n=1 Tax=Streptomyces sp. NBC_00237 TaxID=2975687 RepID=UPI0022570760|nr:hypothetical protein [Streptomyces sp. NBC_00237]MCX5206124.1 hypothetical protein [Streptomyces sp. NBC_00237]